MLRQNHGRHLALIVLVALAALAFARPAAAQGAPVKGTVKDAMGNLVEGAKVLIEDLGSGRKFETTTGKDGTYIQIVFGGQYRITVEKAGVGKVSRTMMLQGGRPNQSNFVIGAGAGRGGDAEEAGAKATLSKEFDEGIAASRAGNQDEAIAKFETVLSTRPTCSECYYNIGFAQAEKKDYDKAEAAYKKAIELKADYADAYTGLANIYNAQRKFDLATAASAKATEVANAAATAGGATGGGPDALFNQGVILWNQGKIPEAKKQFEAAIAAKPDYAEAHYQLAMALVNGGDLKGASAEFTTYLKLAPNGPNAASAKALVAQLPK